MCILPVHPKYSILENRLENGFTLRHSVERATEQGRVDNLEEWVESIDVCGNIQIGASTNQLFMTSRRNLNIVEAVCHRLANTESGGIEMVLRIVVINPTPAARAETGTLGHYLQKRGHETHFYAPFRRTPEIDSWNGLDVRFFRCNFLPIIRYPIPSLSWDRIVLEDIVKTGYDIVQACDYDYLTSLIPLLRGRIPFSRRLLTTDAFPGIGWTFGMAPVDLAGKAYTRSLGRLILKSYSKLVLLHENLVPIATSLGVPEDRIKVIHNGVDTQLFKRTLSVERAKEALGMESDCQIILYVGRLSRVKGIDVLLKATRLVQAKLDNVKLIVVGSGEERYRLQRIAMSIDARCQFIGNVPQRSLPIWYSAADVLVLPSRSEGIPNTILEGAAVGVPIVSTDVGGVSTFITNEVNGLLVTPGSSIALAESIERILFESDLAKSLTCEGSKVVLRRHSWEKAASMYEDIYEEMCHA